MLPGTAMFEASIASASMTATSQTGGPATVQSHLSIVSPMILSDSHSHSSILQVDVASITGACTIQSLTLNSVCAQLHMRSNAAASPATPTSRLREELSRSGLVLRHGEPPHVVCTDFLLCEATRKLQLYRGGTLASIDASQSQPDSGYWFHPTVADSCLHTGAIHTSPSPTSSDQFPIATAKVPVGVTALTAPSRVEGLSMHASMGVARQLPDGTLQCSFSIASCQTSRGMCLHISELQVKDLPRTPIDGTSHGMQYEVDWLASSVVAFDPNCATPRLHASWSMASSKVTYPVWRRCSGCSPVEIAALQLQTLQAHLAGPRSKAGGLTLLTAGSPATASTMCTSIRGSAGIHAATAAAMLRVAAQEHPATQWQSYGLDDNSSNTPTTFPVTDGFGTISTAGVWRVPQLTASLGPSSSHGHGQSGRAISAEKGALMSGTVLVTGGLGRIGFLVGCWISTTWPASRVLMLSRTGRAYDLPHTAFSAKAPITAVRCDVSNAGELAALLEGLTASGAPPVVAAYHAGGILEVSAASGIPICCYCRIWFLGTQFLDPLKKSVPELRESILPHSWNKYSCERHTWLGTQL